MDEKKYAKLLKALSDENRLKIMELLAGGEKCACVLLTSLEIGQPTLSHHMKLLCESGLVSARKEGKWTHYKKDETGIAALRELFYELCGETAEAAGFAGTSAGAVSKAYRTEQPGGETADNGAKKTAALAKIPTSESVPPDAGKAHPGSKKIKLYVLTGFLGSGKTTLLLRLMQALSGKKLGIIQNEFGKLGIDGELLRNDEIQMVELNRGSIFCSCLKLQFVQALAEMAERELDYLFVESSGIGDPSNVGEILSAARELAGDRYDFAGVLCLVDALNFFSQLEDEETVQRQLRHCHMAVITKVDLADADRLIKVREKIRELNPLCRIEVSANGNLAPEFFSDDLIRYQFAEGEDSTNVPETKPKSLTLWFDGEIEKKAFEAFLRNIEDSVYRVKGFFCIKEEGFCQVDVVGKRIDYKPCGARERSQLVLISRIGPQLIRKVFDAWEREVGLQMELKN